MTGALVIVRLDKARGNAIDEPLVARLHPGRRAARADPGVRGVLLASAHPKLFSPGLDLVTLIEYDRAGMERFMRLFAEMRSGPSTALRKPMVAAIDGHAVAGGCILALTADHRVLKRGGAQIGLNEVKVGVPLPWSVPSCCCARRSRPNALDRRSRSSAATSPTTRRSRVGPGRRARRRRRGFEDICRARLEEFVEKDRDAVVRHQVVPARAARWPR